MADYKIEMSSEYVLSVSLCITGHWIMRKTFVSYMFLSAPHYNFHGVSAWLFKPNDLTSVFQFAFKLHLES